MFLINNSERLSYDYRTVCSLCSLLIYGGYNNFKTFFYNNGEPSANILGFVRIHQPLQFKLGFMQIILV